jgi:hypothetical protein
LLRFGHFAVPLLARAGAWVVMVVMVVMVVVVCVCNTTAVVVAP